MQESGTCCTYFVQLEVGRLEQTEIYQISGVVFCKTEVLLNVGTDKIDVFPCQIQIKQLQKLLGILGY